MNALVTVAVPMCNVEKYLPTCLNSIVNQTYRNLEIILVDDGSPDLSGKIADDYASKDSRIKVVHQSNKGYGGARNAAIDIASGNYITFVDADDYLMPDFVEYMLNLIVPQKAEMAISKNNFTTSDLNQIKEDDIEIYNSEQAVIEFFLPNIQLGAWNKIYDNKFLKEYNLRFVPELKTGEGLQFITHAAYYANKIAVGRRKVYVYRINNATSATTKANVERQGIGALETMDYIRDHFAFRSKAEKKGYDYHRWGCYKYCLRQIVESHTEEEYFDLYKKCKRKLRRGAISVMFYSRLNIRYRSVAFIILLSPVGFAKLQIWKKNNRLKQL